MIKYLDEQIIATVSGFTIPDTGVYVYYIEDIDNNTIFQGNVFLMKNANRKDFNITEILRNFKPDASIIELPFYEHRDLTPLINQYKVYLVVNNNTYQSSYMVVAMCYRYPNKKASMTINTFEYDEESSMLSVLLQGNNKLLPQYPYIFTNNYPFVIACEAGDDYDDTDVNLTISGALEGNTELMISAPSTTWLQRLSTIYAGVEPYHKYPYSVSSLQGFVQSGSTFVWNEQVGQHDLNVFVYNPATNTYELEHGETQTLDTQTVSFNLFVTENNINGIIYHPIKIVVDDGGDEGVINLQINLSGYENKQLNKNMLITFTSLEEQNKITISNISFKLALEESDTIISFNGEKVADIDMCPSKYYLMWQDRGGSYQSQPFNDKVTYSESFDKSETHNYYNARKLSNVQVQPKWKINSDWIPEELYPFYESIFVSSHLLLYDAEEDVAYNVMVTGDYTEKTYKNQKSMFNLTLELEENKKQNIVY